MKGESRTGHHAQKTKGPRPTWHLWVFVFLILLLIAGGLTVEFFIWRTLHPSAPWWYFLFTN